MEQVDLGTFSFKDDIPFETRLGPNLRLRMESMSGSVACVYFVNDKSEEVPVPPTFSIQDETHKETLYPIPGEDQFLVSWTSRYSFIYTDQVVFSMDPLMQVDMYGPEDLGIISVSK